MRTTLQSAADKTMPAKTVPTVGVPSAPALPADLEALLRRLRLPHVRRHAPEVVATAKAQRCEPVETLKALLVEEVAGRERSALATRRSAAGFPTGKIHRTGSGGGWPDRRKHRIIARVDRSHGAGSRPPLMRSRSTRVTSRGCHGRCRLARPGAHTESPWPAPCRARDRFRGVTHPHTST
jgi:hypothetical protein